MPYGSTVDLPESVRSHLPQHAQEIYLAAFNRAWQQHGPDEARAHRIVWAAVARHYHKGAQGRWLPNEQRQAARERRRGGS